MEFLFLDQRTMDELYPTHSDFYDALGPKTPIEKAALVWRIPKTTPLVICKVEHSTDGRA
jgi:hypothetical protein